MFAETEWSTVAPGALSLLAVAISVGVPAIGNRRERAITQEHRMIDQLQEERDHWQRRAEAAEARLAERDDRDERDDPLDP